MFAGPGPHVFGLPPGADFPARLAEGLLQRLGRQTPEALARVTIFLNTQRMRRRLRACLTASGATLLPRLRLVTELGGDPLLCGPEPAVSGLGRRLELVVLIDRMLRADPSLAPRGALFDLADSLAALMDEMRAEGVDPEAVAALDVEGHAAHWARSQRFLSLVERFFDADARPDAEARLRAATLRLIEGWQSRPPADPVIVAGSTGSRGTTALLMQAVVRLPQGALVLPGHDFDLPEQVWDSMADAMAHEDHPQFRHRRLMALLKIAPGDVSEWTAGAAPDPARNRLLSLSLRPAPVTDQWITEGGALPGLSAATARLTLLEAPTPRAEAMAIALRLRQAVEEGQSVALISPDRDLTRRVSAALDRWGVLPDDSAGQPLPHTPPGRLLRLTARAMGRRLTGPGLLALLKHPLAFAGADRGPHLLLTRDLELELRRHGPAFPDAGFLTAWAEARKEVFAPDWARVICGVLETLLTLDEAPLPVLIARHRAATEALARGADWDAAGDTPWDKAAGIEALLAVTEFQAEAPEGFVLSPLDYPALLDGVLARRAVRDAVLTDERVQILGPQEARIQGANLVILAGLNEGIWPGQPSPDPWLNRKMRAEAGLLLPERRIGLAAHDYQMAAAAPQVVLSRALRDAEAETVPSRWLNRLVNLLAGLPDGGGPTALADMRARGADLMAQAAAVERPLPSAPAVRPAPRPPVALRPARLSLTEIERLIRDPYAIYAKHLLKLHPLSPLRADADARLRGEVVHRVMETLLKAGPLPADSEAAVARLLDVADTVLAQDVPWPVARTVWRGRLARIARPFVEALAREGGTPVLLEEKHTATFAHPPFTLVGKPDRIDLLPDGSLRIVDYKTGKPPGEKEQRYFAKQLLLAAVMADMGAFPQVAGAEVREIVYQGLGADLKAERTVMTPELIAATRDELLLLLHAWAEPGRGYTSRRAVFEVKWPGDYDDLARHGEWDATDAPVPEDVP
ncbi:double-strand break repair protein AddB [Pseudogemmobacter blasticus]|uniref:Double-strand break repair protein AddB n=1 Tax=Fuscovulum blasticum DSM 2131 TaxID=1188250 RepID=A0A2T4JF97_FUSBL|nr:double-strand break repair protein AddB [Fuscovulum blasticum]PTE16595.1 double-strand break repair protein AddB [Fuscovulum blasticum DSM 2131]